MALKVLIFIISLPVIYRQLEGKFPDDGLAGIVSRLFTGGGIWLVFATILLTACNWGVETLKWNILLKHIYPVNLKSALGAVITGVYISLFTPNRSGEFLGRIIYLPGPEKLRGAVLSFCGSMAQISTTIMFGTLGLSMFLVWQGEQIAAITTALLGILASAFALFIFFNFQEVLNPFLNVKFLARYATRIAAMNEIPLKIRAKVLILSNIRYLVFTIQFLLLLQAFGVAINPFAALAGISASFLGNFAIPTLTLTELGVRGVTALYFLGAFSTDAAGIAFATYSLWFINLLLPALAGGFRLLLARYDDGHLV